MRKIFKYINMFTFYQIIRKIVVCLLVCFMEERINEGKAHESPNGAQEEAPRVPFEPFFWRVTERWVTSTLSSNALELASQE